MTQDHDIDIEFEPAPPDKLYAHHRRQLSAMLDGELSPDQARFMLRRLQHDGELAACWERWQVCGEVLRGRGHALLPADFSGRVAAAIAAPAAVAAPAAGGSPGARRQHRLARWGGGALAASVALVALFMARQLPDTRAPELVEAGSQPALVAAVTPPSAVGAAGEDPAPPATTVDPAAALLAAAPAAVAISELPRRNTNGRGSSRSQSQRVAVRRAQAAEAPARIAAASLQPPPVAVGEGGMPLLARMPSAAAGAASLFGELPVAASRPWPRAVLPGLSTRQPFAAGYGLPQAEAFAPFQPRLGGTITGPRSRDASVVPAAEGPEDEAVEHQPESGSPG